jgi:hypothetical protein
VGTTADEAVGTALIIYARTVVVPEAAVPGAEESGDGGGGPGEDGAVWGGVGVVDSKGSAAGENYGG